MSGRDEVRDGVRDVTCDVDDEMLDESMRAAVAAWREEVPVRAAWRAELLRAVDAGPAPHPAARDPRRAWSARPWSVRPWLAVAASLAIAAVSGGVGYGIARVASGDAPSGESIVATTDAATSTRANVSDVAARSSLTRFALVAPGAHRVALVGDFNRWDPARMPMRALGDGRTWVLDVPLRPGRHVYAYVVDGDLTADPSAPRAPDDDFGVPSSVVLVLGPG